MTPEEEAAALGGTLAETAPTNHADEAAALGGAEVNPEDLANDPERDPFADAEKLHRSILAKGGTDEDFGKHPLFPIYQAAQNKRVEHLANDPKYDPAQEYYNANENYFNLTGVKPGDKYAENLAEHQAQIAADLEASKRVNAYRARTFGNPASHGKGIDWRSAAHGVGEQSKELFGVLPVARGTGYQLEDIAKGSAGIVSNDPETLAKAELARRELQRAGLKTGLGFVNLGRGLRKWWSNRSWLPGGTPFNKMTDQELQDSLESEARYKVDLPARLTAENYAPGQGANAPADPNQPTHAQLVNEAGSAPTAWADSLRFGTPKDVEGKPEQINPEEQRAGDINTAQEFALYGGSMGPGSRLGLAGQKVGALAMRAAALPFKIGGAVAKKAIGATFGGRVAAAAQRLSGAVGGAVSKILPSADEVSTGIPPFQRGRIAGALAEGVKSAIGSAGGALPFALAADKPDEGISTMIGLGLMGGLHAAGGEALTGNAWKAGAVSELANKGADLKTGTIYDAAHAEATKALDPTTVRQLNAVRGLVSRFKDANGNPFELHALTASEYQAMLARENPNWTPAQVAEAANSRGYTTDGNQAFINTGAQGNAAQPGFHEGGHIVKSALQALDASVRESAKSAIAQTLYQNGKPIPAFQKFIDTYNQHAPTAGKIDLSHPEGYVRAEDEFIAEHFRNIGNKGDAKGLGAIATGDTIAGRIANKFGEWAKTAGIKAPDKMGELGWQEVPDFSRRFNKILNDAFRGAHKLPQSDPSAANKTARNTERMQQITALPPAQRTPDVLAEYAALKKENETLAQQGAQIPPPAPISPPPNAPGSPTSPVPAPTGVSDAQTREDVKKALIQLKVPAREADALAKAAQGASASEMLNDALKRRTPRGALATPSTSPAATPKPAPVPAMAGTPAAPEAAKPTGALSTPEETAPTAPSETGARLPTEPAKPEPIVSYDYGNSTPEAAAQDAAVEQQVATLAKTKDDRLHQLVNLTTARAGADKGLMQRRVDKNGKVSISGRIDPTIPEHRALLKELDLAPEVEQQLMAAQTADGAKYVDYYSAPKEKGAEGDISGKQRRAEYEADKLRRSRSEKDMQRNKAILFTGASLTKDGFVMQKGLSIDKFLANVHKLLEAAKEHNLGVDYHGINDHQIQQDLDGYVQNHKNNVLGDGSRAVAGKEMTPGYEPYLIPRNRFDLLNAAFHNEASTGVKRYEGKLAAHEAAKASGEKTRKPALRAETAENATEAQDLARENQWQVDDETGDTNPFRALLNKEGKLVTIGKGGALRKGTQENLEGVWESLNPAHIDAIRDQPVGNRDIVRDVGYTGEPKGVFSKGLPDFKRVAGGFMPETPIVGVVRSDGDVEFKQSTKNHTELGLQRGSAWRYSPTTEEVYWHGDSSEHSAKDEQRVSDFLEADGYDVKRHKTLGELPQGEYVKAHNAAHGLFMPETRGALSAPNKTAQSYHTIAEKRGALSSGISLPGNDQKPTVNPSEYPKGYRQQNAIDPRATSSEDATRSLAAFQERQSAQGGRVSEPGKARSVSEFRASLAPLLKASQDAGRVWSSKPRTGADTGGQEHDVITSGADGKVLKFTHPDTAGKILTTRDGKSLSLTNADPSDYLHRIRLQNEVFGDDIKIEGVEKNKEGQLSIVTSQRAIHGTEPNESDVAQTMHDAGFTQVGPSEYYRAADNILVGDAHTGNFVKTPDGTVPIDVTIQTPDGKLLEWAEREAQNKRLPQKRGALQGAAQ